MFLEGRVEGGDWLGHTSAALAAAASDDRVLLLWYEELRKDPLAGVQRIAQFLGLNPSLDTLEHVAVRSSLDNMRNDPLANVEWTPVREGEAPALREGATGGWRRLFTRAQEAA
eukprot:SM004953S17374  [mRNA]  locus=s4953:2:1029:- [translate_table: standard]